MAPVQLVGLEQVPSKLLVTTNWQPVPRLTPSAAQVALLTVPSMPPEPSRPVQEVGAMQVPFALN
jgi:hypothetical protein